MCVNQLDMVFAFGWSSAVGGTVSNATGVGFSGERLKETEHEMKVIQTLTSS
jgi:hypothetical protein